MTKQQLTAFVAVAENGSFSKAEHDLFLSKQAIKKQIDALEEELDFPLFTRSHQGISLTLAGKEMYHGVKGLLGEVDQLVKDSRKLACGNPTIRIENPNHPRLMLEKAFMEFSRRYPNVRLEVIMNNSDHFVGDLLEGRADVVECILNPTLMRPGIACKPLFHMPYRCLMSPNHILAGKGRIQLKDLAGCRVAVRSHNIALQKILGNVPGLKLESVPDDALEHIYNICNNNGILISKAFYLTTLHPFVAVTLDTELTAVAGILYREKPSKLVTEFLQVIDSLYHLAAGDKRFDWDPHSACLGSDSANNEGLGA